jgi:hypothetical protein
MTKEELEKIMQYANYPEGSPSKALYDSIFMPFEQYLEKYYKDTIPSRWTKWMDKFVYPPFDKSRRKEYWDFLYKAKPSFVPDFDKMDKFWEVIKNDCRFDEELKRFFAFLYSCDFFECMNFETWLNAKNWLHPWRNEPDEDIRTILEILNYPYGINYLKTLLRDMPWLNRP